MLIIFAKFETDEKVLVSCQREQVRNIQLCLNNKYGGSWVPVDNINPNEILRFADGMRYVGFTPGQERYCNLIEPLELIRE